MVKGCGVSRSTVHAMGRGAGGKDARFALNQRKKEQKIANGFADQEQIKRASEFRKGVTCEGRLK